MQSISSLKNVLSTHIILRYTVFFTRNITTNTTHHDFSTSSTTLSNSSVISSHKTPSSTLNSNQTTILPQYMRAWLIYKYGDNSQLTFDNVSLPILTSPKDVLIKVSASSVNPIDFRRRRGYAGNILNIYQLIKNRLMIDVSTSEFPLILGRDFCGEIVRCGPAVTKFKCGDKVYGALQITRQGSFAEYCTAAENEICLKPNNLTDEVATSLPLVSLTSWYALRKFGGITPENAYGKRALLLGASGGVGHIALQLLTNLGIETTALCGEKSFDFVRSLGAYETIDYKRPDLFDELSRKPKFQFVLDTIGSSNYNVDRLVPVMSPGSTFVTIISPLFRNTDKYGILPGLSRSAYQAVSTTLKGLSNGISYRWAFYIPDGSVLNEIKQLVEQGKLKPTIDSVYTFQQTPDAIEKVENGRTRGKVVIKM